MPSGAGWTCSCPVTGLRATLSARPECPALVAGGSVLTYGRLGRAAGAVAAGFGVEGSVIALRTDGGPGSMVVMVAAHLAARACALLDAGCRRRE